LKTIRSNTKLGFALAAALGCGAAAASGSIDLLMSGPVEAVDHTANVVTVLGHKISLLNTSQIALGQRVNVFGLISSNGTSKPTLVQSTGTYVGGGDNVVLVGRITAIDSLLGRVSVDGAIVDYTSLLSSTTAYQPALGANVRILGTQPAAKGLVLASSVTTVLGVTGGGLVTESVGSSRAASLGATHVSASKAGVTGGGLASSGVTGGGLASSGVTGGGFASSGVTGGGLATSGVTGGGLATSGVTGGGFATSGVTGGGLTTSGVTGGGLAAYGVTGGGLATSAVRGGTQATK